MKLSMNTMKPTLLALLISSGLVAACTPGHTETQTSVEAAKVVQLTQAMPTQAQQSYQFPAEVVPVKTVNLNFEVSGRLDHVDMIQGTKVAKGHLLASIDDAPFARKVRTNKAINKRSILELERVRSLRQQNMAAQQEMDNAEVSAELAQIDLENSIQDLSYTKLIAPFDALISERLVEEGSFISAGTPVVTLQDISKIRFEINVSERVLSANLTNQVDSATASVIGKEEYSFPITYVEHTTQPDPITQTYKVLFEMEPPKETTLHPGMRAYVNVTMKSEYAAAGVLIPMTALVLAADGSYGVWAYDKANQRVHLKGVSVAGMEHNFALVTSGLELGESVVSAGISQMSEGLRVQPYQAK